MCSLPKQLKCSEYFILHYMCPTGAEAAEQNAIAPEKSRKPCKSAAVPRRRKGFFTSSARYVSNDTSLITITFRNLSVEDYFHHHYGSAFYYSTDH